MPSKKSKQPSSPFLWKPASNCSKQELQQTAGKLALELRPGDRILLEGSLGAGKTTFARYLLNALGVHQPAEGSPSFAIAHEYSCPRGEVVHIDFYRLKGEQEIEDAGIPSYFWEREAIVISEWLSSWPEFQTQVLKSGRCFQVQLELVPSDPTVRTLLITDTGSHSRR